MSKEQSGKPKPHRTRMMTLVKIIAAGLVLIMMTILVPFMIMFIGACRTPAPPPAFTLDTVNLLNPAETARSSASGAIDQTSQTAATIAHTNQATSQTQAAVPRLRYPEFIRDMPDLPPKLRANRDSLNLKFDRLLEDVAEYEAAKAQMTTQARHQKLDAINQQTLEIQRAIRQATDNRLMEDVQNIMALRNRELIKWYFSARIENNSKSNQWQQAAVYSQMLISNLKHEWAAPHRITTPNMPLFQSEFYHQMGNQEWRRLIYCYRQAGGMYGYGNIAAEVYKRGKETVADSISRFVWRASHR